MTPRYVLKSTLVNQTSRPGLEPSNHDTQRSDLVKKDTLVNKTSQPGLEPSSHDPQRSDLVKNIHL